MSKGKKLINLITHKQLFKSLKEYIVFGSIVWFSQLKFVKLILTSTKFQLAILCFIIGLLLYAARITYLLKKGQENEEVSNS